MAIFNLQVLVQTAQANAAIAQTGQQLGALNTQARAVGGTFLQLAKQLGITFGIVEIIRLTDAYTQYQNRLRTIISTTEGVNTATAQLLRIANETRSSLRGTVELFTRLGNSLKGTSITEQELLDVTESLNQAVVLSGAGAKEAENAIIQLSQGMSSGTLRGDELRAVLEQLPIVADIIAREMGVTRGELRKLGADGQITAGIIVSAFQNARTELSENFARSIPTLTQALTVLTNNLTSFFGQLSTNNSILISFSQGILAIANNLNLLSAILGPLLLLFAAQRLLAFAAALVTVQTLVAAVTNAFVVLRVAGLLAAIDAFYRTAISAGVLNTALTFLAANPITVLVASLGILISLLITFEDEILASLDSIIKWGEELSNAGGILGVFGDIVQFVAVALRALIDNFLDGLEVLGLYKREVAAVGETAEFAFVQAEGAALSYGSEVEEVERKTTNLGSSSRAALDPLDDLFREAGSAANSAGNSVSDFENALRNLGTVDLSTISSGLDSLKTGSSGLGSGNAVGGGSPGVPTPKKPLTGTFSLPETVQYEQNQAGNAFRAQVTIPGPFGPSGFETTPIFNTIDELQRYIQATYGQVKLVSIVKTASFGDDEKSATRTTTTPTRRNPIGTAGGGKKSPNLRGPAVTVGDPGDVRVEGVGAGQTSNFVFNISTPDPPAFRRTQKQIASQVKRSFGVQ